jgi:hypothetical protein
MAVKEIKMRWHFRELQTPQLYRTWVPMPEHIRTATQAKRYATKKQTFQGAVLEIRRSPEGSPRLDDAGDWQKHGRRWVENNRYLTI